MTNHSETTGSSENGDITGLDAHGRPKDGGAGKRAGEGTGPRVPGPAYDGHGGEHQVTLRTPAELADALPYLLGYRPEDSIVLVALHDRDGRGRFGGRARLGIPANADDWPSAARQLAHGLVTGSERRGARPESMVAFLCQEPLKGESGRQVMERLRPLAHRLRVECGSLDVTVVEALCISDGRYWSYCCDNAACCPPEGASMGLPGTSVLAAAATYAGIQVRGTLRELRARLLPWENAAALEQETALDTASLALVPRILDDAGRADVADETLRLAGRILDRFARAQPVSGMLLADLRDDELLAHDEAARLILGLQDRATRDRAAEWMEGDEAGPALRLWRSLARRCVGPYGEHAAAPLTLVGWVAWSTGDELEAREALAMALAADPDYLFARLLHQACNEGLDPESVRNCLRAERDGRGRPGTADPAAQADGVAAGAGSSLARAEECAERADDSLVPTEDCVERAGGSPAVANDCVEQVGSPRTRADGSAARATGSAARNHASPAWPIADARIDASPARPIADAVPTDEAAVPESEPETAPASTTEPSRRRRRTRSTGAAAAVGRAPGGPRGRDRVPSARVPRRRTPADTTRPAGAADAGTRTGRGPAGTAASGSGRTGGARARTSRKTAMQCRDIGQEGVQPSQGTEGEE
ncbi:MULTISPECIES: DUF4192 family protein [Streptomyces]|uniref:DUF4192 domain-containing protein n=1 Tax=Streptomyces chartreusis NRRL 3882 TaxID=1079985 RepID=A0A2N9B5G7_STRCX|nr:MULTISPECIES: DUF4192 domain-containing protein [Streptomyces]SOR78583.1 hypothetical protein SCNRRL3882_2050 [Streptomyces chartreusis NRRL 3882]